MASTRTILLLSMVCHVACLIPLIDGGNKMPKMFECYFNDQIAKQASTAVSKAITAGKVSKFRNCRLGMPVLAHDALSLFSFL